MATSENTAANEKSGRCYRRRRRFGVQSSRRSLRLLEAGPDWQLGHLISSDFWGRRLKPAGPPFLLEGKNPYGYVYQAGWVQAGPRCTISRIFPGSYPTILKSSRRTAKGSIGRSTTPTSRHIGTRSPTTSASRAMPRLRKFGDPPVNLIRCRRCGLFPAATSGKRASRRTACGLRRPPSASIRRRSKADRRASTTVGAKSAVRSEHWLIRLSPISVKHGTWAPRCGRRPSSRAF